MSARLWARLFVVMVVLLMAAVVVLLYRDHQRYALESALVPIVKPDTPETKVHPKDPEGMDIPNTELSIYEHLDDKNTKHITPTAGTVAPVVPPEGGKGEALDISPDPIPPDGAVEGGEAADIPFMPASSLKGTLMDLGFFTTREEAAQTWARAKTALPPSFGAARPMLVRDQGTFHLYIVDIPDVTQGGSVCTILTKIGLFCQMMGP